MGGKVLVPMREHADRLNAARLQCDVMGSSTLIIARTDAEAATFLTSTIDSRDHPFILGATKQLERTFDEHVATEKALGRVLEAETKEEEVQAQDETKQEFFSPSKKAPGRLTDARKAPYEPKVAETPLPPLAKALKPVETPASTTSSFGEEGGDVVETPPPIKADPPAPAPVHGAAGRVLGLKKHDPPKGTPVVAQQLDSDKEANAGIPASTLTPGATAVGKENADAGAISKFTAFVANFVKPEEPGGATA